MLCNFLLLAAIRTAPGLYEAFGFKEEKPALIALLLFSFLVSPMDEVTCSCLAPAVNLETTPHSQAA